MATEDNSNIGIGCPICISIDTRLLSETGTKFTIENVCMCLNCGLGFLHPRLSQEEIEEYYLTDEFSKDFRNRLTEPDEEKKEQNRQRAQVRWDNVKHLIQPATTLLEIGCSSGEFLECAREKTAAYGIDASTGFAESSEDEDILVGIFPQDNWDHQIRKWNTIAMFHVLEHVDDPLLVLTEIRRRLFDDGLFILEYPDLDRASRRKAFQSSYFQKAHLYDFSLFNVMFLLAKAGFSIRDVAYYNRYPEDKNLLLICETAPPGDGEVYPTSAKELYERLSLKLKGIYLSPSESALTVFHIASHNINVGDGAITAGIRRVIGDTYNTPTKYVNLDIVDFSYYGEHITAEQIMAYRPDVLLIGGGGTIDGHPMRTHTGTALTMPIDELEKINIPTCFVGLGYNLFPHQEFHSADKLLDLINHCDATDKPFSVRMDGSFERLEKQLSVPLEGLVGKVPDPGFFVPVDDTPSPYLSQLDNKTIVIQLAFDALPYRFGGPDAKFTEQANMFLGKMCEYITWLVTEYNADIVLALHTTDDLMGAASILKTLRESLDDRMQRIVSRLHLRVTGVAHPTHASQFFRLYKEADLIVGMRGHSVICGTGLGTPTIALSTHDKVDGFMEEAGIRSWSVYFPWLDESMAFLVNSTRGLLENPEKQPKLVAMNTANWRDLLAGFLTETFDKVI